MTAEIFFFHIAFVFTSDSLEEYFPLSAALQGFNFLSAFLYANKPQSDWRGFFKKELPKLLIPGVVAVLYIAVVDSLVYLFHGPLSFEGWLLSFQGHTPGGFWIIQFGNLYYCLVIAVLYLTLPLFQYSLEHKAWRYVLLGIALLEFVCPFFLGEPICYAPFAIGFYYGRIFQRSDLGIEEKKGFWAGWPVALLGLLLSVLLNDVNRLFGGSWGIPFTVSVASAFFKMGVGIFLAILILRLFKGLPEGFGKNFFRLSDALSYPIFLTHFAFMIGALSFHQNDTPMGFAIFGVLTATLLSAFVVYQFSRLWIQAIEKRFFPPISPAKAA